MKMTELISGIIYLHTLQYIGAIGKTRNHFIGFVHAPTHPHRTLAAMKRLLELRAIFDDPAVNRGVIHLHPPFLHEVFDMARAQRVRHIPANPHQNNLWGEMGPFEMDRHRRSPS
jgi:hypothetical protein